MQLRRTRKTSIICLSSMASILSTASLVSMLTISSLDSITEWLSGLRVGRPSAKGNDHVFLRIREKMRLPNKNRSKRGRLGKITAIPRRVAHDAKFIAATRLQSRVELPLQAVSRAAVERQSPKHVKTETQRNQRSRQKMAFFGTCDKTMPSSFSSFSHKDVLVLVKV